MSTPTPDAGVRTAGPNDLPALGVVQALVWQEAYDGVVPPHVHAAFDPQAFAAAWRDSLRTPPEGVHRLLVACAGEQVIGFAAIGPSQDPDAGRRLGERQSRRGSGRGRRTGRIGRPRPPR